MRTRGLLWAAGALPVVNVVHALVPAPHHQNEAIAGPIMGTALTLAAIAAFAGLLRRRAWAPRLAVATAVATIAGFALFHALPVETAVTEPYWGDGSTNGAQVASLALIVATAGALWTAACARRATT
jgi:hypothetical protein